MATLPSGFVLDSAPASPAAQNPRSPVTTGTRSIPGTGPKPPAPPSETELRRLRLAEEANRRAEEAHIAKMTGKGTDGDPFGTSMVPAALATKAQGDVGIYTTMQGAADSFEDDYGGNWLGGLENTAQAYSPIPVGTPGQSEWWGAFKATDNQIRNDLFGSALTSTEKAAYSATTIEPGMNPAKIRSNLERRSQIIRDALSRQREFMLANGYRPEAVDALFAPILRQQEQLTATADSATKQQDDPAAMAAMAGAGGDPSGPTGLPGGAGGPGYNPSTRTRTVNDNPALAAEYRQRLAAGQTANEIIPWLREQGVPAQGLMQAVEQIRYRTANPNVPIESYSITSTREEPLSPFEHVVTGLGSGGAGAYALGAGQFLTGNTLDNMAADPERARQALAVSEAQNPTATTVGNISGGWLAALTGEAGLARLGMASGLGRGLLADTAMGAANGAGAADGGDRITGAAQGGLGAALGSLGGTALTRGAARAVSPSGGSMRGLYDAGVRPTPGQRFADSGLLGRALNASEEALQSVPLVGSAIRGAREGARDQFQIGAFNQALAEIGEELPKGVKAGTDPHRYAQTAFDRAYDEARSGMRMVADEQLANDLSALAPEIQTLSELGSNRARAIMATAVRRHVDGNELSGEAYKSAVSDLGKHIARFRRASSSEEQQIADILEGVRDAMDGAARRSSDPAAVALLDAADAGYAQLVRIEDAAARRGGDSGTFSPAQLDAAVQKQSGGVRSKQYLRGDAAMQGYASQGRGLSDRMANSGTSDRAMAAGSLATVGAAYLEPTTLGVLGALGLAYAPGVRKAVSGVLAPGGPTRQAIARRLEKRAQLAGKLGAGTGAVAALGTTPGQ